MRRSDPFMETHDLVYNVVRPVLERLYGTDTPRYDDRIKVEQVPWTSAPGKELRARLKERAPLFLAAIGLRLEDFSAEAWKQLLEWVDAACLDGGLEITDTGELVAASRVIKYYRLEELPREFQMLHRLTSRMWGGPLYSR